MTKDDNPIIQEHEAPQRSSLTKDEVLALLRERVMNGGFPTVKDEYGTPQRGVETGLDEAFVIDRPTYEALIQADPKSQEILKSYVRSNSIVRWRVEPHEAWLIHTAPGTVSIDDYPAVRDYLAPYRSRLEARDSGAKWYELAQAGHIEPQDISDLKIIYQGNVSWPGGYTLDQSGAYHSSDAYYLRNGDYYIAGLLNSKLYWFLLSTMSSVSADGVIQVEPAHLEVLPVPRTTDLDLFAMIGGSSELCHKALVEQRDFYDHVLSQLALHLTPNKTLEELSSTLRHWHMLSIDTLQAEVKRLFDRTLDEEQVQMWDDFLNEAKYEFTRLNSDIARGERQIDLAVCHTFGMTEEEIEYILGSL
jgi:hypothetical protein